MICVTAFALAGCVEKETSGEMDVVEITYDCEDNIEDAEFEQLNQSELKMEDLTDIDETEGETEDAPNTVTIRMVGDILLHTPVEEAACSDEDGTYDFSSIFQNTHELIEEADLAMVNQEVIIGGEELGVSGYPAFNAPTEIGDALVDDGFDVILHATNHALDKGGKGISNCLQFWNNNYPEIKVTGIHDSIEDQEEIEVVEMDGLSIAILNYTYGTNGIPLPSDMPYAVDELSEDRVVADITKAKELADFVIVAPHWGTEYRLEPDLGQEKWTKIFLQNGVNLVIGTHPHVIEPIEMLHDDETGNDMLVYYSLGNFVNWTSGTGDGVADRMVGGMAMVDITCNDTPVISSYGVTALVTDLHPGDGGVTVYRLSDYSQDMASQNEIVRQDSSFSYDYCVNLCNNVWGDIWE